LTAPAEAHAIAADLVTACEARLGPAHPATVRATAVLAAILHDRAEPETEAGADDLARAEGLYLDVIAERDIDEADPAGPTARAVALARANLALLTATAAICTGPGTSSPRCTDGSAGCTATATRTPSGSPSSWPRCSASAAICPPRADCWRSPTRPPGPRSPMTIR
jgi:hypothetical protein